MHGPLLRLFSPPLSLPFSLRTLIALWREGERERERERSEGVNLHFLQFGGERRSTPLRPGSSNFSRPASLLEQMGHFFLLIELAWDEQAVKYLVARSAQRQLPLLMLTKYDCISY